jgi:hypothetical protein
MFHGCKSCQNYTNVPEPGLKETLAFQWAEVHTIRDIPAFLYGIPCILPGKTFGLGSAFYGLASGFFGLGSTKEGLKKG